jgi:hypothetical protein
MENCVGVDCSAGDGDGVTVSDRVAFGYWQVSPSLWQLPHSGSVS